MSFVSKMVKKNLQARRKLFDEEIQGYLDPFKETGIEPNPLLSLTNINSKYIEIIDTGYQWLGVLSSVCLPLTFWFCYLAYGRICHTISSTVDFWFWANLGIDVLFLPLFILIFGIMAWSEFFRYTYFPVRFNRINRTVYKFRLDGSVASIPWDEIHFSRTPNNARLHGSAYLQGCWLENDRKTVKEHFTFGTQCEDDEGALAQWEFIRRYMEYGPKDLIDRVMFCMPVDGKKESYLTGLERISCHFGGPIRIIMLPFSIYVSFWRWLAMRTHKIPVWSKEVEDACAIDPDDPYVKDYRINPKDLQ